MKISLMAPVNFIKGDFQNVIGTCDMMRRSYPVSVARRLKHRISFENPPTGSAVDESQPSK